MKTSMWYMLLKLNRASSRVKWTWCVKLKECPLKATEWLWFQLKVHYAVLVEIFYKKWNIILCFYAWTNSLCCHDWIDKLTFKHNNISHCLTLFICGRPRHLSSFKQLIYSLMEKCIFLILFYELINIVNIKILSFDLLQKNYTVAL